MKKIYLLALLALASAKVAYADANVTLTSAHQESYVAVSTFTGASTVASAVSVTTTLYPHRSFAAYNGTDHDLVLVIVGPSGTLSSSSISPLYIPAGAARVIDNGSDQVVLPAGAKIYVYYPGSAPTSGSLILDQLF